MAHTCGCALVVAVVIVVGGGGAVIHELLFVIDRMLFSPAALAYTSSGIHVDGHGAAGQVKLAAMGVLYAHLIKRSYSNHQRH